MATKRPTKTPQHVIDEAVKRHMAGESVRVLAKYYKISVPQFYNWIAAYKQELLEQAAKRDMSPKEAELVDKRVLIAENQAMKLELRKLRDKVINLMIKTGDL